MYIYHYLAIHLITGALGLFFCLMNQKVIRVEDLCWAIVFGPFYMVTWFASFDRILIDIRPRDKK